MSLKDERYWRGGLRVSLHLALSSLFTPSSPLPVLGGLLRSPPHSPRSSLVPRLPLSAVRRELEPLGLCLSMAITPNPYLIGATPVLRETKEGKL